MIWNSVGSMVYLGCQWLTTILVTIIGGYQDAGVLSVASSVSAMFQTVAMFGIRNYQVSDTEGKYSNTAYTGFRLLCCGAAFVITLVFSLVSGYLGGQLLAIMLFLIFRLAESYADVLHGIAQKNGRLDIAGKSFFMKGVGTLVLFVGAYWLTKNLNLALFLMAAFSVLTVFAYDILATRRISEFRAFDSFSSAFRLARETLPLFVYYFLFITISTVPKLFLEGMRGEEILGVYSTIAAPVLLLQVSIGYIYNPFVPRFAELFKNCSRSGFLKLFLKISLAILVLSVVFLGGAHLLGDFIFSLVFGEDILLHMNLLTPIILFNVVASFLALLSVVVIVLRNMKLLIAAYLSTFAVLLAISAPMINLLGANGASVAPIIASAVGIVILATGTLMSVSSWGKAAPEEENIKE